MLWMFWLAELLKNFTAIVNHQQLDKSVTALGISKCSLSFPHHLGIWNHWNRHHDYDYFILMVSSQLIFLN